MIELSELKSFVRMHEHKLRAKVNALEASRLESKLHGADTDGLGYSYDQHDKNDDAESRYYYRAPANWKLGRDGLQDSKDHDYAREFTRYLLMRR
jgi:hypothetical protein